MTELFAVHEVQRTGRAIGRIHRPGTIADALRLLAEHPDARPIAGGTDLILDLHRGGPGPPVDVIDLTGIVGFRSIDEGTDAFELGGGVTHNQVVMHAGIRTAALPLAQACLEIGSPQLRNRATIAGNLVTASPANDTISALMALGASVELGRWVDGDIGLRRVAVVDMFDGFRSTVLRPDELVVTIRVPKLGPASRGLWVKLGLRRAQAISVVHAGVVVELDADGVVVDTTLALGSVAPTVVVIDEFRTALVGHRLDAVRISQAATAAVSSVQPIDDLRATADYRSAGVVMLVERALRALAAGEEAAMWPDAPPTLSAPDELDRSAAIPEPLVESTVALTLNGREVSGGQPGAMLLDWIRDEATGDGASLSGAKEGCAEGECGACTVLLDGAAVMSCLVAAGQADGAEIITVEGLRGDHALHPIQQSFIDETAVQCGFCIPGFIVAGARLLTEIDRPSDEQIRLGLSGNLCRCTGYYPIIEAVRSASS